jgi:tRNA threonylcarbamoyl adenosine modification protein YeaZ
VEREAIEVIVLGLGPGSYTGIRVAIAIAQGWQLALGVKLLGVSTADVLAEQAREEGGRGRFHVAIDAQRGEFYHAAYDLDEVAARALGPLRLDTLETVKREAGAEPVLGGAEIAARLPGGRVMLPNAATLGRLAAGRTDFLPGGELQPIYLRATSFVKAPPTRTIAEPP